MSTMKPLNPPSTLLELGWKAPTSPFHRRFSSTVPDDVLPAICCHLQNDKPTLLALQRVSKAGWASATKYIYRRVELEDAMDVRSIFCGCMAGYTEGIGRAKMAFSYVRYCSIEYWDGVGLVDIIVQVASALKKTSKDDWILPRAKAFRLGRNAMLACMIEENESMKDDPTKQLLALMEKLGIKPTLDKLIDMNDKTAKVRNIYGMERNRLVLEMIFDKLLAVQNLCLVMPEFDREFLRHRVTPPLRLLLCTIEQIIVERGIGTTSLHTDSLNHSILFSLGARVNRVYYNGKEDYSFLEMTNLPANGMTHGTLARISYEHSMAKKSQGSQRSTIEPRWEIVSPHFDKMDDRYDPEVNVKRVTRVLEETMQDMMANLGDFVQGFELDIRNKGVKAVSKRSGNVVKLLHQRNARCCPVCDAY